MRYNQKLVDRSLTKIQKAIERDYPNIKSIATRCRLPEYIEAREVFYYIAEKTGFRRTQIGNFIGMNHSSVTTALNKLLWREDNGDKRISRISERIIIEYGLENVLEDEEREKLLVKMNKDLADIKNKYTDLLFNINRADLRALLEEMIDLPDDIVKDTLAYVKARKVVFKTNQDKVKIYISNTEGIDPRQQWG